MQYNSSMQDYTLFVQKCKNPKRKAVCLEPSSPGDHAWTRSTVGSAVSSWPRGIVSTLKAGFPSLHVGSCNCMRHRTGPNSWDFGACSILDRIGWIQCVYVPDQSTTTAASEHFDCHSVLPLWSAPCLKKRFWTFRFSHAASIRSSLAGGWIQQEKIQGKDCY